MGWNWMEPKEIRLIDHEGNPCKESVKLIYGQDRDGYFFYITPSGYKVELRWYEILLIEEDEARDIQIKVNHYRKVQDLREKLNQAEKEFKRNV